MNLTIYLTAISVIVVICLITQNINPIAGLAIILFNLAAKVKLMQGDN